MMPFIEIALTLLHVLAGAAWFGSMFYSLSVLQPRARLYFNNDEEFDDFITFISHGARWKVLSAFGLIALSGMLLTILKWNTFSLIWIVLIGLKTILFLTALATFIHVSWRLWPQRIFADPDELPRLQRRFKVVGYLMITLVGINMILGVLAHMIYLIEF